MGTVKHGLDLIPSSTAADDTEPRTAHISHRVPSPYTLVSMQYFVLPVLAGKYTVISSTLAVCPSVSQFNLLNVKHKKTKIQNDIFIHLSTLSYNNKDFITEIIQTSH